MQVLHEKRHKTLQNMRSINANRLFLTARDQYTRNNAENHSIYHAGMLLT